MQCIKFTIDGVPVPKGRPRFARRGKHVMAYTPDKTLQAERQVALIASQHVAKPLSGAISVSLDFYMPIPKATAKSRLPQIENSPHIKRPDADNLAKLVMDALNGLAWNDDSQIANLFITKQYSENPRTEVSCNTL